jgi:DNA-binding NarL/FixJ family response regulator
VDIPEEARLKTLIVEDNANYRGLLRDSLQSLFPSMMILEATEGNEALQKVDTLRPDLIFVDIRLPGESGLQLTQRIKTNYPDTKVIIMTAYDALEYQEAATQCGAICFIAKDSVSKEQIETMVKSVLSGMNKASKNETV